jgi:TonB family protein
MDVAKAGLLLVVMALASPMAVAAEELPCDLRDIGGAMGIASPTDFAFRGASGPVTVSLAVDSKGALADARIESSSKSAATDQAVFRRVAKWTVSGNCQAFGNGRLFLAFKPDDGTIIDPERAWRAGHVGPAFATAQGFLIDLLAGPQFAKYNGQSFEGGDYACSGKVVSIRLKRMPPNDDVLVADEIHELSPSGDVLGSWRVPLESRPFAIRGDRLTIDAGNASRPGTITVTLDGRLMAAEPHVGAAPDAGEQCPHSSLPESGYRWCVSLLDAKSRKNRLIAFNGPCT